MTQTNSSRRVENVGILAMEVYFPSYCVDQVALEAYDNIPAGKYTVGLGLKNMGFCSDREDINSLSLTVLHRIMQRNNLSYNQIGRLEVGTETIIDKSKSTKSVLMQLFKDSGNSDVEGIDTTNACYGGTSALFNAVNWVESNAWDGRYAIVVCADIAVYSVGSARCTGGAGACALLIGPDAPLIIESELKGNHMQHVYDFYKPDMTSEYPTVDGKLSIQCYLQSLDVCYRNYSKKFFDKTGEKITLDSFDMFCFHSPFCKLVQKSVGRLALNDFLHDSQPDFENKYAGLQELRKLKLEETYADKDLEKTFLKVSEKQFNEKTKPTLLLAGEVGNMYTASLYGGLASLLATSSIDKVAGKRFGMFSYGSGSAATLYSIRVANDAASRPKLESVFSNIMDIPQRLKSRKMIEPKDFSATLTVRENNHLSTKYTPIGTTDHLFPGTFYLTYIDEKYRRSYEMTPLHDSNGI